MFFLKHPIRVKCIKCIYVLISFFHLLTCTFLTWFWQLIRKGWMHPRLKDERFVQTNVNHHHSTPPSKIRSVVKKEGFATDDLVEFHHHPSIGSIGEGVWLLAIQMCLGLQLHGEYFGWNGVDRLWWLVLKIPTYKIDRWSMGWSGIENVMPGHTKLFN